MCARSMGLPLAFFAAAVAIRARIWRWLVCAVTAKIQAVPRRGTFAKCQQKVSLVRGESLQASCSGTPGRPHAVPALAGMEFSPSSVGRGVLLVASPSLDDPNFRQAVVLVVEHGPEGTLGLILNRSTRVLLSEALPDLAVLKGTTYRLFAGGPVEPNRLLLLFRLKESPVRRTIGFRRGLCGGHHWGPGTHHYARPNRPKPSGLSPESPAGLRDSWDMKCSRGRGRPCLQIRFDIFDKDPATLWMDCLSRLQAPRVISN